MKTQLIGGLLVASLAWAPTARADDVQKAKAEAQADVQKERADAAKEKAEAQKDADQKAAKADAKVQEAQKDAGEKVSDAKKDERQEERRDARATREQHDDRMATHGRTAGDRDARRNVFDGKDNFEVKGRIASVNGRALTVTRDDLPAAKLHVDGATKIELDGDRAAFDRLKAGQEVRASFNLKGDRPMAVEIKADAKK
jgi:hypothetical protein